MATEQRGIEEKIISIRSLLDDITRHLETGTDEERKTLLRCLYFILSHLDTVRLHFINAKGDRFDGEDGDPCCGGCHG